MVVQSTAQIFIASSGSNSKRIIAANKIYLLLKSYFYIMRNEYAELSEDGATLKICTDLLFECSFVLNAGTFCITFPKRRTKELKLYKNHIDLIVMNTELYIIEERLIYFDGEESLRDIWSAKSYKQSFDFDGSWRWRGLAPL